MPLKLLKRSSKQYNVVSKTMFIISVELLDNGVMECGMDTESTGQDCLLNISQRLGLHQPEFFGLRYISRGVPPRQRWVEMNKPLKRQLEKYAEDFHLSLGVMFYVSDVNSLKDEMARYHYFLQAKSDVIDGKLNCSIDQAISLAAYSLQAEFGDYDHERHTIEYLRDFAKVLPKVIPKELAAEEKYPELNIDSLYETVARQYGSLIGFPPPLAEIYYIMIAQQLDGYGQESFPAKAIRCVGEGVKEGEFNEGGSDVLICVSINGLVIRRRDWMHIAVFRWNDVKSLIVHKRTFIVEGVQSTMQFQFSEPEVAKYVRKMGHLQSSFYKETILQKESNENHHRNSNGNYSSSSINSVFPNSSLSLRSNSELSTSTLNSSTALNDSGQSQYSNSNNYFNKRGSSASTSTSTFDINLHPNLNLNLNLNQNQQGQGQMGQYGSISRNNGSIPHQLRHSLSLSLTGSGSGNNKSNSRMFPSLLEMDGNGATNNNSGSASENKGLGLENIQLPSYRQAPDYKTAMQLKYGQGAKMFYGDGREGGSQSDDDEEPIYQNEIVSQLHSIELRESLNQNQNQPNKGLEGNTSNNSHSQNNVELDLEEDSSHLQYMYKPPPAYPGTSTATSSAAVVTKVSTRPINSNTNTNIQSQSEEIEGQKSAESTPKSSSNRNNSNSSISSSSNKKKESSSSGSGGTYSKKCTESQAQGGSGTNSSGSKGSSGKGRRNSAGALIDKMSKEEVSSSSSSSKNKNSSSNNNNNSSSMLFGKTIDEGIIKEYEGIQESKADPKYLTALKRDNSKRNRAPEILPFEDNIIRLNSTRFNPNGYINASPISASLSGRKWKYITGQIPPRGYESSIWQMIWEMECKIIAVLDKDATAPFYPLGTGSSLTFNEFQVIDGKSEKRNTASIARELNLIYLPKKKQRKVWILPYEEEWKDDVPIHTEHFLCFLEEVNSIQRKVSETNTPLVVLCGTGAGRSGILILSDLLLHAADSGHKLRCDNLLGELRTQRMKLVSSVSQYAFVLHTLAKYLAQSRLI